MGNIRHRLSLASHNVRRRFVIGITLISIIPILAFLYLGFLGPTAGDRIAGICHLLIYAAIVVVALTGYVLLSKHPEAITRLRSDMEQLAQGEFPERPCDVRRDIQPVAIEDDIVAIEKYMDLIVDKLKGKVESVEREKVRLERQLFQERKVESLSIMASGMSHDFNNMLAAIIGNATGMARNLPNDSPMKEHARQIESTALRAIELARLMHTYSGKGNLIEQDIQLTQLVRGMENLLRENVPNRISIEYRLGDDIPLILGDPAQIQEAVVNLVNNAAESILDGQGSITITTGVTQCDRVCLRETYLDENLSEGRYVYLEVTDTGRGIAPDAQEKMFDPFFTTKIRGRGLGLSVVLGIVRSHGGAISVQSEPDKGTTFRLLFPCSMGERRVSLNFLCAI